MLRKKMLKNVILEICQLATFNKNSTDVYLDA